MGDDKAKNVIEYLDFLLEKGKASSGTIRPMKIAFSKVLRTVDGQSDWENTVAHSIDVEDYMARFANLTMGQYSSESLAAYKSRTLKALTWYRNFLDKPGWTPTITARPKPERQAASKQEAVQQQHQPGGGQGQSAGQAAAFGSGTTGLTVSSTSYIQYPFPLSDGQLIQISLPVNLSKKDAHRIGVFIESIAVEEPLQIGPGASPDKNLVPSEQDEEV